MSADAPLDVYAGRRVFLTGHTGFKGAWLAAWLDMLGADVVGFALPPGERGAFVDLGVAGRISSLTGDVTDAEGVGTAMRGASADLVFHLAAQPLVRTSWADRRTTFATNVMGTLNVLEAALAAPSVAGIVCVTTDKVYENDEAQHAFREGDRLGGHDPYSASKAAAELAIRPYRSAALMGLRQVPIVSARAGNVIGGGDWSADRLVPDIARALELGEPIVLRRPDAVRPWQHVLDCLHGYLLIGAAMLRGTPLAPAYNFAHGGPTATVLEVAEAVVSEWGAPPDRIVIRREADGAEAGPLILDASLAQHELGWRPAWSLPESIRETVRCYRDPSIGRSQIADHMQTAGAMRTLQESQRGRTQG